MPATITVTISKWDQPHPYVGARAVVGWGAAGSREYRVLVTTRWPQEEGTSASQTLRSAAESILRALEQAGM